MEAIKTIANSLTMTLRSGRKVDVFDLKEDDVDISDIAHALSNLCRWGGHCPYFYSVAQHAVLCSYESNHIETKFEALMHDASEAYMADLPRPIKRRIPQYKEVEDVVLKTIFTKYNINPFSNFEMSDYVHVIDNRILKKEHHSFFVEESNKIEAHIKCDKRRYVECWSPKKAKQEFLKRFKELSDERK